MDCISFRKHINGYIEDKLDDELLCEFLHHLESCKNCRDELEINYIVVEGVRILDEKRSDYNLSKAYDNMIASANRYIRVKRRLLVVEYVIDTLAFWMLATLIFLFIRILLNGV